MLVTHVPTPLAGALLLSCLCAVPAQKKPGQVDPFSAYRADPQCWDLSSARLLQMRSPGIADTVPAFWELMVSLKASEDRRHAALFWDLAQVFWDIYVDCVLSRGHGLGRRRQVTSPGGRVTSVRSLITDKSVRVLRPQAAVSRVKRSSRAWLRVSVHHVLGAAGGPGAPSGATRRQGPEEGPRTQRAAGVSIHCSVDGTVPL